MFLSWPSTVLQENGVRFTSVLGWVRFINLQ